ncbi:hypothetical protein KAW08_04320 [bacterium]|nr:hypothetical protein [bacterium]
MAIGTGTSYISGNDRKGSKEGEEFMPLEKIEKYISEGLSQLKKDGAIKGHELVIESIKKSGGDKLPQIFSTIANLNRHLKLCVRVNPLKLL